MVFQDKNLPVFLPSNRRKIWAIPVNFLPKRNQFFQDKITGVFSPKSGQCICALVNFFRGETNSTRLLPRLFFPVENDLDTLYQKILQCWNRCCRTDSLSPEVARFLTTSNRDGKVFQRETKKKFLAHFGFIKAQNKNK